MMFIYQIFNFISIISSSFMGLSSSSFFFKWVFMEFNLIMMLPFLMFSTKIPVSSSTIKFFSIQSMSGLTIMILILVSNYNKMNLPQALLLDLFLIFKMGGFPFQQWVLDLSKNINWFSLSVLLTFPKFIPLDLLSNLYTNKMNFLIIASWPSVVLLSLVLKSIKKIIILSSVYMLMMIVFSQMFSSWKWKLYLLMYIFLFLSMAYFFSMNQEDYLINHSYSTYMNKNAICLIFFSLSGFPPLPGFILKMDFLSDLMNLNLWFCSIVYLISSVGLMYLYLSILFTEIPLSHKKMNSKNYLNYSMSVVLMSLFPFMFIL